MADSEAEESPFTQLLYALIIAALRKRAPRIVIDSTGAKFELDGVLVPEVGPSTELAMSPEIFATVARRVGVMAEVPVYRAGTRGQGAFRLVMPARLVATECLEIAVIMSGHGPTVRAELELAAVAPDG